MREKYGICMGCGKSSPIRVGFGNYCSLECKIRFPGQKRKCRSCERSPYEVREVTFRDGTQHLQRLCLICRHGIWISRKEMKSLPDLTNLTDERAL